MGANRFSDPLSLEGFARYFLARPFGALGVLETFDYGSVHSCVLYRDAPWQAELFILRPGVGFPRQHRHPDVDSIEHILSAHVPLIVNGVDRSRGRDRMDNGELRIENVGNLGAQYRVDSTDWHGVGDVPDGGSFLSLQQWKNGRAPSSVGLNWEGTPVSEVHRRLLRDPRAVWIKTLQQQGEFAPCNISDANNEWNKTALAISAEMRNDHPS